MTHFLIKLNLGASIGPCGVIESAVLSEELIKQGEEVGWAAAGGDPISFVKTERAGLPRLQQRRRSAGKEVI